MLKLSTCMFFSVFEVITRVISLVKTNGELSVRKKFRLSNSGTTANIIKKVSIKRNQSSSTLGISPSHTVHLQQLNNFLKCRGWYKRVLALELVSQSYRFLSFFFFNQ